MTLGSWDFLVAGASRSFSSLLAELGRSIVGRARWLHELATGASTETFCTPKNPQGLYGVDMSGPAWGSAPCHVVAGFSSAKASANLQDWNSGVFTRSFGDRDASPQNKRQAFRFYVRQHEEGDKVPYSRVYLRLYAHNSSASTANVGVTVIAPGGGPEIAGTVSITGTTPADYDTGVYASVKSGWNTVVVDVKVTSGTGNPTYYGATWVQTAKRGH